MAEKAAEDNNDMEIIFEDEDHSSFLDITSSIPVKIMYLHPNAKAPVPSYESSAGLDLIYPHNKPLTIYSHSKCPKAISLGFSLKIPDGFYAEIHSRSGLACMSGIEVVGDPIIDPDFTGPLAIHLRNTSNKPGINAPANRSPTETVSGAKFPWLSCACW